jgi:DNA-binding response OmpR family regulator
MSGQISLEGFAVLVLEDDYYLADDAKRLLEKAGARVIGPFSRTEAALAAVAQQRPSCALVDINLGGGASFTTAEALRSGGVPIIFVTGYDARAIPSDFRGIPHVEKPVEPRKLLQAVSVACRAPGCPPAPGYDS